MTKDISGSPIITLISDFGTHDGYVGAMKGVMLGICPEATLVDISHDISRHNVLQAALVLQSVVGYFPDIAIHLVVVDPGVGSQRRALALETPQGRFVGPDNGVLGLAWAQANRQESRARVQAVSIESSQYFLSPVSPTFHGRDLFAPVAAHLAKGLPLAALGPALDSIAPAPVAETVVVDGRSVSGQIVTVDRFGNCLCSITADQLLRIGPPESLSVRIGGIELCPIRNTYADVLRLSPLALISSSGRLELALREGDFCRAHQVEIGAEVLVYKR